MYEDVHLRMVKAKLCRTIDAICTTGIGIYYCTQYSICEASRVLVDEISNEISTCTTHSCSKVTIGSLLDLRAIFTKSC